MFFIAEKQQQTVSNFSLDSFNVTEYWNNGTSKKSNLLNEERNSKSVTTKWGIFNHQSNSNYDVGEEIISNKEVLKSTLCDYNNAYILVRADIITTAHNSPILVAFINVATFTKSITKIDGTAIDDTEDLDLVTPMYNLIKYSSDYSDTTCSLWFYSKDEATNFDADILNNNVFESFTYKDKLLDIPVVDGNNSILKKCNNSCTIKISK